MVREREQARPAKLGRYELEECLGSEGPIETYRARVRGLAGFDRIFAVKCLRRGRGAALNLNDPFVKVAKRTATVTDARIARVLDADVIDGVAIAVTEFVHGLDLERFREWAHVSGELATGTDEPARKWQKIVAYIGSEIAGGLAALHALSPPHPHGGLSPRNVVLTTRGGAKLLDVGLAAAAQHDGETTARRTLPYVATGAVLPAPTPEGDMRALGVVLFELATGELPPHNATSATAHEILDSLWPSMADFISALLADEPRARPSAAEATKILAEHWSDVPDASMVSEMSNLVRNFSSFVADVTASQTAPPLPIEEKSELASPQSSDPSVPPPAPAPDKPVSGDSFLSATDGPTVARTSGSFVSSLFQSLPTDASIPTFEEADRMVSASAEEPASPLAAPEPDFTPPPAAPPESVPLPVSDPAPIQELADWGAQALAALGDQAGVSIAPLVPPTTTMNWHPAVFEPPPAVSDPVIEEAFAFVPEPPPAGPELEIPEPPPAPPVSQVLLEDELVDDQTEPIQVSASALMPEPFTLEPDVEEPKAESVEESASTSPLALEATAFEEPPAPPGLEATAFDEPALFAPTNAEENGTAEEEASSPETSLEPADSSTAVVSGASPEPNDLRSPAARSAVRSSSLPVTNQTSSGRARRVVLILGAAVVVGGSLAVAAAMLRPVRKQTGQVLIAKVAAKLKSPSATIPEPPAPKPREVPIPEPVAAGTVGNEKPTGAWVNLPVASVPEGAMVWINGEERGRTPCTLKLRGGDARVVLVRAGYLSSQLAVEVREGAKVDETLKAVAPPMDGDARFRAECKTEGKLPIVVDGKETGILCPYSKMKVEPGRHTIGVFVPAIGKVHAKEVTLPAGVRSIAFGD